MSESTTNYSYIGPNDILTIIYDGANITYYLNGFIVGTTAITITGPLYFVGTLYQQSQTTPQTIRQPKITNIKMGNFNPTTGDVTLLGGAKRQRNRNFNITPVAKPAIKAVPLLTGPVAALPPKPTPKLKWKTRRGPQKKPLRKTRAKRTP